MSRTGPEYVESETELFADLDLKSREGTVPENAIEAFIELYEFANEIGDRVTVGGAKNANFQIKVDAHTTGYAGNTSIFTATVNKRLQIWPANRPLKDNPNVDSLGWGLQDYKQFERGFSSLEGVVRGETAVDFVRFASQADLDRFKEIVEAFVATCRGK